MKIMTEMQAQVEMTRAQLEAHREQLVDELVMLRPTVKRAEEIITELALSY